MTNKWDDEKIQKLLHELPDIQDNRSKEDVLSRLKQDNRMQNLNRSKQKHIRKNKRNFMPAFVAVAVLLVLTLLLPSMLTNNSSNDKASIAILNEDGKERHECYAVRMIHQLIRNQKKWLKVRWIRRMF